MLNVGDKVNYVPHICHALDRHPRTGDYPWVMGFKTKDRLGKDQIEELTPERVEGVLDAIRKAPDPSQLRVNLTFIRPSKLWPAVVREVLPDGTYGIDIESINGGVTLHYDHVPLDDLKKQPHSCHGA